MISRLRITFDFLGQAFLILVLFALCLFASPEKLNLLLQFFLVVIGLWQLVSALNFILVYSYRERKKYLQAVQFYLGVCIVALLIFNQGIFPPDWLHKIIFLLCPFLLIAWYFVRTFLDYRKINSRQKSFWDLF